VKRLVAGGSPADTAPQDRAQAREQLTRLEGFRQVIVRAQLEADDAVDGIAAPGEHEHRGVGVGAQLPAKIETVHVGKHQIEHDGVVLGFGELPQRRGAQRGHIDPKSRLTEILRQHLRPGGDRLRQENTLGHSANDSRAYRSISPGRSGCGIPCQALDVLGQRLALRRREYIADITQELHEALRGFIGELQMRGAYRLERGAIDCGCSRACNA